jgi:hypothetical protein
MAWKTTLPAILLIWGCGSDDPPGGGSPTSPGTEPEPEAPSPYIGPEGEPPVATADLSEIEAAAQAALDGVRALNGRPVQTAYEVAMLGQEGACPDYYANDYGTYWYDTCTSSLGSTFSGYAFAYFEDDYYDEANDLTYSFWQVYGGGTVVDAVGLLELSGSAFWLEGSTSDNAASLWQTSVAGTFSYDGPEAAGTWLAGDGNDPDLYMYATRYNMYDANYLYIDGGYSGFGEVGWAASFADLELMDALVGTSCPEEPGGTMAIRAGDGGWYDLLFQGATSYSAADDDGCDGCADVFFEGDKIGQACVDIAGVIGWDGAPW